MKRGFTMELDFNPSPELLQKANTARTPEELQALAKENGMDITPEQAREYFDRLPQTGELADDELDNVSGGCAAGNPKRPPRPANYCCDLFSRKRSGEAGCGTCKYADSAGKNKYYCTHSSNFDYS